MARKEFIVCDVCNKLIKTDNGHRTEQYVDASVYGVEAHVNCFEGLGVPGVLNLLGLDQIRLVKTNGEFEKYIYVRGPHAMEVERNGQG